MLLINERIFQMTDLQIWYCSECGHNNHYGCTCPLGTEDTKGMTIKELYDLQSTALTIPCKGCLTLAACRGYFNKRESEYDSERDLCEDYNSESMWILGKKCSLFNDFLFLDETAFPSRNYHFMWWREMESKISEEDWLERFHMTLGIFQDLFIIDSC